ncbi:MAG: hypothetical protein KJ884_07520 [Gammaproteobacteria bacterium]|nr:hypothetical protein [Gammaproteobacteria bacterium]
MPNPNAYINPMTAANPLDPAAAWAQYLMQFMAPRQAAPTSAPSMDRYRYTPQAATSTARRAQEDALADFQLGPTREPASDEDKQAALLAYDEAVQAMAALDQQIAQARQGGDAATLWGLQTQRAAYQQQAAAAARVDTDPQQGIAQVYAKLTMSAEDAMQRGLSPTQSAMERTRLASQFGTTDDTGYMDEAGPVVSMEDAAYMDPTIAAMIASGNEQYIKPYLQQKAGITKTSAFDKVGQMLGLQGMMEDITSSRAARKRAEESAQRAAAQQAFANLMARSQLQQDAFKLAQNYGLSPDAQYVPGFEPGGLFATMAQRGGYGFSPMAPLNLPQPAGLANPAPQWAYQAMNRGM